MKKLITWLAVLGMSIALAPAADEFFDGFEEYAVGVTLDTLAPTLYPSITWAATNVIVTTSPKNSGANSASLTNANSSAALTFDDGLTNVWTEMYLQPVFGDTDGATNPPAGATFAFYVNATSNVVVYTSGSTNVLDTTTISADRMTRFTVHSDHVAQTWDLYVDGTNVAPGLAFYSIAGTPDYYNGLGILYGDATTPATVDDVKVSETTPPMSSGIDLQARQTVAGVVVDFTAYDVEADGVIEISLIGEDGEVTWTGSAAVTTGPEQQVSVLVPGLELDGSYHFRVRDEVGTYWDAEGVTIDAMIAVGMLRASALTANLEFNSVPGQAYDIQWVGELGGEWQTLSSVTATGETTSESVPYPEGGESKGFFRIQQQ